MTEHGVGVDRFAAAGRSGVAVGFPRDPLLHVSWAVLLGSALLLRLLSGRARG